MIVKNEIIKKLKEILRSLGIMKKDNREKFSQAIDILHRSFKPLNDNATFLNNFLSLLTRNTKDINDVANFHVHNHEVSIYFGKKTPEASFLTFDLKGFDSDRLHVRMFRPKICPRTGRKLGIDLIDSYEVLL